MITLLAALALQPADPLLASLLAEPPVAPACSVTLTVDVDEAGDAPEQQVYRYDAPSDSWTYVSYNGGEPPEDEVEDFEDNGRDGGDRTDDPLPPASFYADSVEKLSPDWARLSPEGAAGPALYALEDLPKGTVMANGRDLSGHIRLRYLIEDAADGPRVVAAGGQLKKVWRIPLIARIDRFDIQRRFAPAPEGAGAPGAMLPVAEHVEIGVNVLGKDRSAAIDTAYEDWDCAPAEAPAS